jgi:integrase
MNAHVHRRVYERDAAGNPTRFSWQARYRDPKNPRKRHERTFTTKREADRWLREQSAALVTGTHVDPGKASKKFPDLVQAWKDTRYAALAPRSSARYDQVLRKHLLPEFGAMRVSDVDREAVRRYFGKLAHRVAAGEISGGTVHKIHTTLSSIMSEAVELGLTPANPCARVRGLPSSKSQRQPAFLSRDEIERLVAAIYPQYQLMVRCAAYTGLRQSELLALRRRHVNVLHGRVRVEEAIKEWRDGAPTFGETKSGRGRTVGLEPSLRAALTDHLASLPGGDDALVFRNTEGGPVHAESFMRNFFRPAVKKLLPGRHVTFHDLRHTCASLLIASGANALEVKEWMGHASIATTYNVYGHLLPDNVDDLASRLAVTPSSNVVAISDAAV